MDETEARASARVLLAVARADGKVDAQEKMLLGLLGGATDGGAIDLDAELSKIISASARERTLRAAVAIADIDGQCSSKERAILELIHEALGFEGNLELSDVEEEDGERAKLVHVKIEEATVGFLHAVGTRGHELGQSAYEQLVEELQRKKRELLRSLSPG